MDALLETLTFPTSALLAVGFLLTAYALYRFAGNSWLVRGLSSRLAARVLLAVGAVLLAVEGTWSLPLHRSPFFLLFALVMLLSLAFVLLQGKRRVGFMLNHLGLFLIVWAALFGAPDVSRTRMMVGKGDVVNYAYATDGMVVQMPFSVALEDFQIDYYPDSVSPRQFTSHIYLGGEHRSVAVNEPVSHQGYTFFQESYDREGGTYTVLLVVRDPWLPVIYLGMLLLAAGSIMLLFGRWRTRLVVPVTLLLTVLFTALTVAKINFGTLMPALRSWWFVPHLFIYMVAYSLMALSLVMWLVAKARKSSPEGSIGQDLSAQGLPDRSPSTSWQTLSDNLLRSSSALLILGMLTGSVWARQAWGDYWAWDPKENWAAVTWFLSLMHLHLQHKRGWTPFLILLLAFLALQITWYGVNYLPSAMDSMHTYTSSPK